MLGSWVTITNLVGQQWLKTLLILSLPIKKNIAPSKNPTTVLNAFVLTRVLQESVPLRFLNRFLVLLSVLVFGQVNAAVNINHSAAKAGNTAANFLDFTLLTRNLERGDLFWHEQVRSSLSIEDNIELATKLLHNPIINVEAVGYAFSLEPNTVNIYLRASDLSTSEFV